MPSLRDRGPDITILARALLERIGAEMGFPGIVLTGDAERLLAAYSWPGNIRELRNVLERAVLLGDRQAVRVEDVTDVLAPRGPARPAAGGAVSLEEAERAHIEAVLREAGGDVRQAAQVLGLSRSALYQKLKKHGLKTSRTAS
jgi:DNA-binding NtrC family response regulator